MSSLTAAFDEWDWLLANPRFARRQSTVGWEGFEQRRLPFQVTPEHLAELAERGQYSFQVADGSVFQISYQFDPSGDILRFGSLGFYKAIDNLISAPVVDGASESSDETSDSPDVDLAEPQSAPGAQTVPWLRLDFAPSAARGVIHAASHLHVSIAENIRLPVAGVPTPKQFVETVLSWFYPDDYARAHLNQNGEFVDPNRQTGVNALFCAVTAEPAVLNALHLLVPPSAARAAN